jgi:hypothetical protein
MNGEYSCDVCARLGQPSLNLPLGTSCRSQSFQIEPLEPSFHHLSLRSGHRDGILSQGALPCPEIRCNLHALTTAQYVRSMYAIPARTNTKMNETKPRLGKDEVDILQREFEKNPKPTTQTKRQFAEDMGVELSRINVRKASTI